MRKAVFVLWPGLAAAAVLVVADVAFGEPWWFALFTAVLIGGGSCAGRTVRWRKEARRTGVGPRWFK